MEKQAITFDCTDCGETFTNLVDPSNLTVGALSLLSRTIRCGCIPLRQTRHEYEQRCQLAQAAFTQKGEQHKQTNPRLVPKTPLVRQQQTCFHVS